MAERSNFMIGNRSSSLLCLLLMAAGYALISRPAKPAALPGIVLLDLHQTYSYPFDVPSPLAMAGWNYCDSMGNVYTFADTERFVPGMVFNPAAILSQPVRKISIVSGNITQYAL